MKSLFTALFIVMVSSKVLPGPRTDINLQSLEDEIEAVGTEPADENFPGEDNEIDVVNDPEEDPEVIPNLFDGDIAGMDREMMHSFRHGLNFTVSPHKKWDNGIVPYHISKLYSPYERELIQTAINSLTFLSCVKFVPWNGKHKDYLFIFPVKDPSGCWSFIGKKGGQQVLGLSRPTKDSFMCLKGVGKPMHELLHALGMFHEHSRPDRDAYIDINYDNVKMRYRKNFNEQDLSNVIIKYPYDYKSIMHYGSKYFSKFPKTSDKKTITPKLADFKIGQRYGLSKLDCMKLNDLYGCFQKSPFEALKYRSLCQFLGL